MGWLQKYGQFIQQLILYGNTPLQRFLATTNPQKSYQEDGKQAMVLLPKLKKLDIKTHCTLIEVERWLLHCPGLEALSFNNVQGLPTTDTDTGETTIAKDRGVHLLQHCPRLIRLDINNMGYEGLHASI